MVSPLIQKKDTAMRQAITPHERLTATLRFLATGRSYEDLKLSTIMSRQALGKIVPETCRAIYKVLKEYYKVRVHNVKNMIIYCYGRSVTLFYRNLHNLIDI